MSMEKSENFVITPELSQNISIAIEKIGDAEVMKVPNSDEMVLVRVGTQSLQDRIQDSKAFVFPLKDVMRGAEDFCLCIG